MEKRVEELEIKLAQTQRELARKPSREAMPLPVRKGWFLGITREDFTQGTDTFVSVDLWIWSGTDNAWRRAAGLSINARDWFLNDGETLEKETKVKVEWYETTWVVTAMYCSPTDITEHQSSLSPGAEVSGSSADSGGGFDYASAYSTPSYSGTDAGAMTWQG
jgi:hypothetical protein